MAQAQVVAWATTIPWATTFGDPFLFQTFVPTQVSQEWLVAVFASSANQSALFALHADTGAAVWSIAPQQTFPIPAYSGWCDGLDRVSAVDASGASSGSKLLYCGLDDGVVALDGGTGAVLWRYRAPSIPGVVPNAAAPAHPTAVATPGDDVFGGLGFIVFTFENGANSSALYAVRADNGTLLTVTTGERVFTKIWSVAATVPWGITLCSVDALNNISVSVRMLMPAIQFPYFTLEVLWMHSGLPFSPPGIWDNPNLDVDAAAEAVFMYEKPLIESRRVYQFDTRTGAQMWTLPTSGHVVDYDTFAFQGNFYRLVTTNDTTGNGVTVEGYNVSAADHGTGALFLHVATPCDDPNAILLVGGPRGGSTPTTATIFVVGLNTGTLWLISNNTLQWERKGLPGVSTAILGPRASTVMIGVGGNSSFVSFYL
jgi:outer membrane protein assembly factor BamB